MMDDEEMRLIARKRAGYALGIIADNQMNTWTKYPSFETPKDIIAQQILEAMTDVIKAREN